ncbi:MAG TPA: hypothetical protein VJQ26_12800, partial [Ktedonobacteraceae bacterium]|nr:hypothetical protein [Ktedonobacteraceae bacterium]
AILLATGNWLTPRGYSRGQGITPTIAVALSAKVVPLTPNDENAVRMTEQQILESGDRQIAVAIHYLETHQTTSIGPLQGKPSQKHAQAAGLLALEPAFFLW